MTRFPTKLAPWGGSSGQYGVMTALVVGRDASNTIPGQSECPETRLPVKSTAPNPSLIPSLREKSTPQRKLNESRAAADGLKPLPDFQTACCRLFGCPADDYEEAVLRACLYRHARLLRPLLTWLRPDFFAEDLALIRALATATDRRTAQAEFAGFTVRNRVGGGVRQRLRLRLSGQKLVDLAALLFPPHPRLPRAPIPF